MEVKGTPFSAVANRLYQAIKARDMANIALPIVKDEVSKASSKVADTIKAKTIDKDTASVYVNEKDLQYPVSVPGNKKPKPISSNLLLTFLDKGTPPRVIKHLNPAFALHFMKGGEEVFTKKPVNHPGTKAQNVWGMSDKLLEAINKDVSTKFAVVFNNSSKVTA